MSTASTVRAGLVTGVLMLAWRPMADRAAAGRQQLEGRRRPAPPQDEAENFRAGAPGHRVAKTVDHVDAGKSFEVATCECGWTVRRRRTVRSHIENRPRHRAALAQRRGRGPGRGLASSFPRAAGRRAGGGGRMSVRSAMRPTDIAEAASVNLTACELSGGPHQSVRSRGASVRDRDAAEGASHDLIEQLEALRLEVALRPPMPRGRVS